MNGGEIENLTSTPWLLLLRDSNTQTEQCWRIFAMKKKLQDPLVLRINRRKSTYFLGLKKPAIHDEGVRETPHYHKHSMRSPTKGAASLMVGRLLTWKALASITIFLIFLLEWKRFNQMMLQQAPKDLFEDSSLLRGRSIEFMLEVRPTITSFTFGNLKRK